MYLKTYRIGLVVLMIVLVAGYSKPVKSHIALNNNIHFIADTPNSFNSLIGKFKGQVIYVDIWATWCQPCMEELQRKKDVAAFGAYAFKNNITILYICCGKVSNNWKAFIRNNYLQGNHILAGDSLMRDLRFRFSYSQTKPVKLKKGFGFPGI